MCAVFHERIEEYKKDVYVLGYYENSVDVDFWNVLRTLWTIAEIAPCIWCCFLCGERAVGYLEDEWSKQREKQM